MLDDDYATSYPSPLAKLNTVEPYHYSFAVLQVATAPLNVRKKKGISAIPLSALLGRSVVSTS